ncbi:MarR family winged helix-turn-helix transcriptional regulator [Bacillaceae bacterium W0354]
MNQNYQDLDLIDLISARYLQLRKKTETMWNDHSDIKISYSEWLILGKIHQMGDPTISSVARQVDISRQATHKFIKGLKDKGIIEVKNVENNKKKKYVRLTELGIKYFEENMALKVELESKIADKIGKNQINQLLEILKQDWGI